VLRTWLRRWLGVERLAPEERRGQPGGEPGILQLARRVDEIEQHVDFLHGALRKLRGRVTGGLRRGDADPDPDGNGGGPVSDAPAAVHTGFDKQHQLAQLERTRHEEYGRGVKGS